MAHGQANEEFGPLAGLIGTWYGDEGVNISFDYDVKKVIETPYSETAIFSIVGEVTNGNQTLWALDYTTSAKRVGEEDVFHTELGYWLWDPARKEVMRCFMVPRGSTIFAGGKSTAAATHFEMEAKIGEEAFGVLSNPYLLEHAKCVRYTNSVWLDGETWRYEENTVMTMTATGNTMDHTDANTLRKVTASIGG